MRQRKVGRNASAGTKTSSKTYGTIKEALADFNYNKKSDDYERKQCDFEIVGKITGGRHARAILSYTEKTGDKQITESIRSMQFRFDLDEKTLKVVRDMKFTAKQSIDEMLARFQWHTTDEMEKIIAAMTAVYKDAMNNN